MSLIKTVTLDELIAAFKAAGREEQFSRAALEVIFNYYTDEVKEAVELDVIAICCTFAEVTLADISEAQLEADYFIKLGDSRLYMQ